MCILNINHTHKLQQHGMAFFHSSLGGCPLKTFFLLLLSLWVMYFLPLPLPLILIHYYISYLFFFYVYLFCDVSIDNFLQLPTHIRTRLFRLNMLNVSLYIRDQRNIP
eukprot:Pompholyxophrys_sp_v1_NODE_6_length_8036_cov_9.951134.p5 type:complete len:108 gc:universal NODE_6_length_8036_cov_9.951134:1488-1811(+)